MLAVAAADPAAAQEAPAAGRDAPLLSITDCVRIALESSPALAISDERRYSAAQDVTAAYGAFLPNVNLSRSWQKSERTDFDMQQYEFGQEPYYTFDSAGDSTLWFLQTQVPLGLADETINTKYKDWSGAATMNLFNGFAKFSSLGSAKRSLAAAEASRGYTRELVVQDVVMAYYNLLRAEELLKVALETRDQTAKELEKTETYFRLGSAAKSDVLQQRVQLENTRLEVVVADNGVKMAFADLAFAMNRPLAATFRVDPSVLETDFFVPPVEDLYEEALAQRLDLRSNELAADARRKDITTATSGLWPSLDVSARYSRYDNESPYRFGSQTSENLSWGYAINWNVFDRLQTWTSRSKAKANARIAEYELDQARLNAQVEIRQLHNAMVEARERAKVSRETIVQSDEELRLARERFRVGAGTTLDIIVAQANQANARGQEVRATADFLMARAQLERATGRLSPWTAAAASR
ncbi:MAG: TolC family protein [Candidatus Krumholzibacteriia bacterium]